VVWDLDDTLWAGTISEGDDVRPDPDVLEALRTLDRRGILHSIASANDAGHALAVLDRLGLADYFLVPRIGWGAKSRSVQAIADALNIGVDTLAFIDDQGFHLDEVSHSLPTVRCLPAAAVPSLVDRPEFNPPLSSESGARRAMYRSAQARDAEEQAYDGPPQRFLQSLGMTCTVTLLEPGDLARAEELIIRTNQLNTTGIAYTPDELRELAASATHRVLVASLEDRYGPYGTIGLAVLEMDRAGSPPVATLELFLLSCRVLTRGVSSALLAGLSAATRELGMTLRARFRPNQRNRAMHVALRFSGFEQIVEDAGSLILEQRAEVAAPSYLEVTGLAEALRLSAGSAAEVGRG
jgi:FkbH-like protein